MTCRSRFLTADGRILACDEPHHLEGHGKWHDAGAAVTWLDGDPCAWVADPCPDCDGLGSKHDEEYGKTYDCPSCGGSGADPAVPPRLVGIGSTLHRDWPDGSYSVGMVVWHGVQTTDPGGAVEHDYELIPLDGEADVFGSDGVLVLLGDLNGWRVVRPVPPAHNQG